MGAVYLVRHGSHTLVDNVLLGRSDPVGLSEKGRAEARAVAATFKDAPIVLVQTSPRRRCRETAMHIATKLGLPLSIEAALDELDYGGWTGKAFHELAQDSQWQHWNEARGRARPPGGESAAEAQARILKQVADAEQGAPGDVIMVTHAELIRCVLLARQGLDISEWHRISVPPGGVMRVDKGWFQKKPSRENSQPCGAMT
jgi:broad specificity phosphatase PhoE